ncbi:type II toxin-antitoxin system YoeB family toxin [Mesoaciditoga sp.]
MGKPVALRYHLTGYYSRRIDQEYRLIYKLQDIVIISCRYHYE